MSDMTADQLAKLPPLTVEPDRVIMTGGDGLAEDVIFDLLDFAEDDEAEAYHADFLDKFEPLPQRHIMGDPEEDFYQGVTFMVVIRRKSDDRLFGYSYWSPVSKHGEPSLEPNGDENGFDVEWGDDVNWEALPSVYVWLPVEPFTITGYKFP